MSGWDALAQGAPDPFFPEGRAAIEARARGIAEFRVTDPDEALTLLLAERDDLAETLTSDDAALD